MRRKLLASVAIILVTSLCHQATASNDAKAKTDLDNEIDEIDRKYSALKRQPLRDLKTVRLEYLLPPECWKDEVSINAAQDRIKLRLRQSGIRVYSASDSGKDVPLQTLQLFGQTSVADDGSILYSVQVELQEPVSIDRLPKIRTTLATWEAGSFGVAAAEKAGPRINAVVDNLLVQFLNDWSEVNGK